MKKIKNNIKSGINTMTVCSFMLAVLLLATAVYVCYSLTYCSTSEEIFRLIMTMIYSFGSYISFHIANSEFKRNLSSSKKEEG